MNLEEITQTWEEFKFYNNFTLHAGCSFGLYYTINWFTKNPLFTAATVFSIGLAKEIYDLNSYGLFSVNDLIYDMIGIAAAVILSKDYNKEELPDLKLE